MADYNFDLGIPKKEEPAPAPVVEAPSEAGMSMGQKVALGALAALPLLIGQKFGGKDGWMYGAKGVAEGAETFGKGMLDIEQNKQKAEREKLALKEKQAEKEEAKALREETVSLRKQEAERKSKYDDEMLALKKQQADIESQRNEEKRLEKVEQGASKIADAVQKTGIADVYASLNALENLVPGGIEGQGDIPGIGDLAKAADLPIIGGVAELALSDQGKEVRQQIATLRNAILKANSGGAVTDGEAERLLEALGTGVFKTEGQLRNGLKMVRDMFATKLGLAQNAAGPEALAAYKQRESTIHTDMPLFSKSAAMATKAPKNIMGTVAQDAISKELERRRTGATAGVK